MIAGAGDSHARPLTHLLSGLDWTLRRRGWRKSAPCMRLAGLVLRSASTCLLIALPLLCYISDGIKLQFGREGLMPTELTMLYGRSRPLKPNRTDVDPTACKARRLIVVSIDPIDLWANGNVTRSHDEARLSL